MSLAKEQSDESSSDEQIQTENHNEQIDIVSHNKNRKRGKEQNEKEKSASNCLNDDDDDAGLFESDVEYENVQDIVDGKSAEEGPQTEQSNPISGQSQSRNELNVNNFLSVESKALDVDGFMVDASGAHFGAAEEQQLIVKEAFANDAVMEEFETDKKKTKEQRMPKDIDMTLPGWGDWAGACISNKKATKRKKKRFVKKGKKPPTPARDEHLNHVIINEQRNKKFATNQVSPLVLIVVVI